MIARATNLSQSELEAAVAAAQIVEIAPLAEAMDALDQMGARDVVRLGDVLLELQDLRQRLSGLCIELAGLGIDPDLILGVGVQAPSSPEVMASSPLPVP